MSAALQVGDRVLGVGRVARTERWVKAIQRAGQHGTVTVVRGDGPASVRWDVEAVAERIQLSNLQLIEEAS